MNPSIYHSEHVFHLAFNGFLIRAQLFYFFFLPLSEQIPNAAMLIEPQLYLHSVHLSCVGPQ